MTTDQKHIIIKAARLTLDYRIGYAEALDAMAAHDRLSHVLDCDCPLCEIYDRAVRDLRVKVGVAVVNGSLTPKAG